MKKVYGNVVLITGASSGIGKAIAIKLANLGYRVYGTSRKKIDDKYEIISNTGNGFFRLIQLDVCQDDSVQNAVKIVLEMEGTIDILINNAGYGIAGSVEDTSTIEAISQFDTNFFGVHRMCRVVLPIMRKNKRGIIINVSSVAGILTIPFQSMYSASKFALEAMTEALRSEVRTFGIRVVLVEPGDTNTGFTNSRQLVSDADDNSAYKEIFNRSINRMSKDEMNGPGPDIVAKVITRMLNRKYPPVRIAVGFQYKIIAAVKRFIPSRIVSFVVGRLYS